MIKDTLKNVRDKSPLIHNITNYVTANDVANVLLACGASPIMADCIDEAEEITSICSGLNINIGTLNKSTIPSMISAGKKANELNHPVLLDPVGSGASAFRTSTALDLLNKIDFSVIRGNISEIKTLASGSGRTNGVDADVSDKVSDNNLEMTIHFAKKFSAETKSIIVITGEIDIIAYKDTAYCIRNGHPMMSQITGSGCQLSALVTAFISANNDNMVEACVGAVCTMGLCGESAFKRMQPNDGNVSYRNYIIDAVYNLSPEELERGAKYEMR